jgi:hypothetical protein
MSDDPRPKNKPSRCAGTNGDDVQRSSGPVGTTSVWPAKTSVGATTAERAASGIGLATELLAASDFSAYAGALFAHKFETWAFSGPASMRSQMNPNGISRLSMISRQPASSGVMEGLLINSSARRRVECDMRFGFASRETRRESKKENGECDIAATNPERRARYR